MPSQQMHNVDHKDDTNSAHITLIKTLDALEQEGANPKNIANLFAIMESPRFWPPEKISRSTTSASPSAHDPNEDIIRPYLTNMVHLDGMDEKQSEESRILGIAKVFTLLSKLKDRLPRNNPLKVISFGSGSCDEFIALKAIYDILGKEEGVEYKIQYVGLDTNDSVNKEIKHMYQKYPDFSVVTCDASSKRQIFETLKAARLPTDGYHFSICRHFDMLHSRQKTFSQMLKETVCYVSTENSRTLVTSFNEEEFNAAFRIFANTKCYTQLDSKPVQLPTTVRVRIGNVILSPDTFSNIVSCNGLAFNNKLINAPDLKENNSTERLALLDKDDKRCCLTKAICRLFSKMQSAPKNIAPASDNIDSVYRTL